VRAIFSWPCFEVKKVSSPSWLSNSRIYTNMAFLYILWAAGVISSPRREKAHLNRCERNFGSNSTHEKLPASSFSAMVVWAMMCERATVSRRLRRLRSSKHDGSERGRVVGVDCGVTTSCSVDCSYCMFVLFMLFILTWWSGPKKIPSPWTRGYGSFVSTHRPPRVVRDPGTLHKERNAGTIH